MRILTVTELLDKFPNSYERMSIDPYFKATIMALSQGGDIYDLLDTVLQARLETSQSFMDYAKNDVREVVIKLEGDIPNCPVCETKYEE